MTGSFAVVPRCGSGQPGAFGNLLPFAASQSAGTPRVVRADVLAALERRRSSGSVVGAVRRRVAGRRARRGSMPLERSVTAVPKPVRIERDVGARACPCRRRVRSAALITPHFFCCRSAGSRSSSGRGRSPSRSRARVRRVAGEARVAGGERVVDVAVAVVVERVAGDLERARVDQRRVAAVVGRVAAVAVAGGPAVAVDVGRAPSTRSS